MENACLGTGPAGVKRPDQHGYKQHTCGDKDYLRPVSLPGRAGSARPGLEFEVSRITVGKSPRELVSGESKATFMPRELPGFNILIGLRNVFLAGLKVVVGRCPALSAGCPADKCPASGLHGLESTGFIRSFYFWPFGCNIEGRGKQLILLSTSCRLRSVSAFIRQGTPKHN